MLNYKLFKVGDIVRHRKGECFYGNSCRNRIHLGDQMHRITSRVGSEGLGVFAMEDANGLANIGLSECLELCLHAKDLRKKGKYCESPFT